MGNFVSSIMPSKHQSCLLLMALVITFVDPITGDDIKNNNVIVDYLLFMAMTMTFVDPITGDDIENGNVIVDKEAGTLFHHYHHQLPDITLPLERAFLLSIVFLVNLVLIYLALVWIWQNGDIRYKDHEDDDKVWRAISDKFWSDPMNREELSACSMATTDFEEEHGEFDDGSFMTTLAGDDVDCGKMNDLLDPSRDYQRQTVRTEISRAQQSREKQETIDEEEDEVRGQKGNIKIKSTKETKRSIHKMEREAATENPSGNTATKSSSMDRSRGIVNESTSKKNPMGNANAQEQQQNDQSQENDDETKNGLNQSIHEMQSIGARTNRECVTFTASQNPLQDSIQTVDSENEHSDEDDEKAIECETKGGDEWVPILEPQESTMKEQEHLTLDRHTKQETDTKTVQNQKDQNNADHHNSTKQQEVGTTKRWRNTKHSGDDSMRPLLTPVNRLKLSIEIPTTDETQSQENGNGTNYKSNQSMYPMQAIRTPSTPQTNGWKQSNGESVTLTIGETSKNENMLTPITFDDLSECEDDVYSPRCPDAEDDDNFDEDNPFAFIYSARIHHSYSSDEQIASDQTEEEEPKPEPVCNRRENEKSGTTNGMSNTLHSHNVSARPLLNRLKLRIDIPMENEIPSQQQSEVNPHWKELADPPLGFTTATIATNDSEYLRVSYSFESGATTLVRFNGERNKWESSIVLPDVALRGVYGFDTDSTVLYGYHFLPYHQIGKIVAVELESGNISEICKFADIPLLGIHRTFIINGDIHLLHGVHHIIIHPNGKRTVEEIGEEWKRVSISDVLYSEPRNSLIVFGLRCGRSPLFAEYSLSSKCWITWIWPTTNSLDIAHCEGAGMVCTAEGRYLLLFGGEGDIMAYGQQPGLELLDRITVFDLSDHSAMPFASTVRCPKRKTFAAVLVAGSGRWESLAVSGYLRKCYGDLRVEKSRTLPQELVGLLVKWISMGCVHLVEKKNGFEHFRIPASAILYPSWSD